MCRQNSFISLGLGKKLSLAKWEVRQLKLKAKRNKANVKQILTGASENVPLLVTYLDLVPGSTENVSLLVTNLDVVPDELSHSTSYQTHAKGNS